MTKQLVHLDLKSGFGADINPKDRDRITIATTVRFKQDLKLLCAYNNLQMSTLITALTADLISDPEKYGVKAAPMRNWDE